MMELMLQKQNTMIADMMNKFVECISKTVETKLESMQNEIFVIANDHQKLTKENSLLKRSVETLTDKLQTVTKQNVDMETQLDEIEQYSRRDCLVINGLPEVTAETDEKTFVTFVQSKFPDVTINVSDISKAHRLPTRDNRDNRRQGRPMVVKFATHKKKDELYSGRKTLKGTNVYMNELLTKKRAELHRFCISNIKERKTVWTKDGKVFVRVGEQIVHVKTKEDVKAFV